MGSSQPSDRSTKLVQSRSAFMRLWLHFVIRYCLYTTVLYLVIVQGFQLVGDTTVDDYIAQHRNIIATVRGAWDGIASVAALKQALRDNILSFNSR